MKKNDLCAKAVTIALAMAMACVTLTGCADSAASENKPAETAPTESVVDTKNDEADETDGAQEIVEEPTGDVVEATEDEADAAAQETLTDEVSYEPIPDIEFEKVVNDTRDEDNNWLMQSYYFKINVKNDGFEELKASLDEYATQAGESVNMDVDTMLADMDSDMKAAYLPSVDYPVFSSTTEPIPTRIDASIVSIMDLSYFFSGGAHGNYGYIGCNFDSKTGSKLMMADVFEDTDAFLAFAKEEIKSQLEEINTEEGILFEDYAATVDAIRTDSDFWVLDGTGFRYIFNPYEVGPYATGAVEATISYEKITPYIKSEYLPNGNMIAAVRVGDEACCSLVNGLYPRVENDGEMYTTDGNTYLYVGDTRETISERAYSNEAYVVNRNGASYILIDYCTDTEHCCVYDVTDGAVRKTFETVDEQIVPQGISMDGFRISPARMIDDSDYVSWNEAM